MASVALCPRCSNDLFIPPGTDSGAWAQCPSCNVLFQVKDAISRDVSELRLVAPVSEPAVGAKSQPTLEIPLGESPQSFGATGLSSQRTVPDTDSLSRSDELTPLDVTVGDVTASGSLPRRSTPTIEDFPQSSAPTWDERLAGIYGGDSPAENEAESPGAAPLAAAPEEAPAEPDPGLASERTLADISVSNSDLPQRSGATIELEAIGPHEENTDFEFEAAADASPSQATWDDSERMERLLSGEDAEPVDAPLASDDDESDAGFTPAQTTVINSDVFVTPTSTRRRRRSPVRMLVGLLLSALLGIGLGTLALLWMFGRSGDVFGIAGHLPKVLLPASFTAEESPEPLVARDAPPMVDPEVKPAAAVDAPPVEEIELPTTEPRPIDEPPVIKSIGDAPPPDVQTATVIDSPIFTPDDVAAALREAEVTKADFLKWNATDGAAASSAKGIAFWNLCSLADKLTFAPAASSPDEVQKALELFRETLADGNARSDVAHIVPRWLAFDKQRTRGIFFAGTLAEPVEKGPVVECQVDLGVGGEPLTILVPRQLAAGIVPGGQPIGIVGSIVDSPNPQVSGYNGTAPRAIWVSHLIAL
jgi:hypothetical protein